MKSALVVFALLASVAQALPTVNMSKIINRSEAKPTAQAEAERLANLLATAGTEEAVDFMTPDELAEDMGIPKDFTAEDDPRLMLRSVGDAWLMIDVSIRNQTLTMVGTDGEDFKTIVSTGKKGYGTKRGCYHPTELSRRRWSRKYDNSPMHYAVFYYGGFALHQTPYVKQLGKPASHGCVRQDGPSAKYVFETVLRYRQTYGNGSITICVRD